MGWRHSSNNSFPPPRLSKCSVSFVSRPCFSVCMLPLCMPIAHTRRDLKRSLLHRDRGPTTGGVVLGGVSRVAINSTNTCTHYINRLVQLLGWHLCQKWLLLCTCLVNPTTNRLILMAHRAFLSVQNDRIPVPTVISAVTAGRMDVSASIVANHIYCYLPVHLGCPSGTKCNPVTCLCDK